MTAMQTPLTDPHMLARQQHMLAATFAAARGAVSLDLSGQTRVTDHNLKDIGRAKAGLDALMAQSHLQTEAAKASANPAAKLPHVANGLGTIGRGALSVGADFLGHGIATALAGPAGGLVYTGFAALRLTQDAIKAAGAVPTVQSAPVHHNSGKGSMVMGAASSPRSEYKSFADQADEAAARSRRAPVVTRTGPANAPPRGRRFNYADHQSHPPKADFGGIAAMRRKVHQQAANVGTLMSKDKMNAFAPGVLSERKEAHMSFAAWSDLARKDGHMRLGETGWVSAAGVKAFAQRHHAPSPAQQLALTMH